MTSISEFYYFPNLPAEIRLAIWRLSIPRRIHYDNGWVSRLFRAGDPVQVCRCKWKRTHNSYALPALSQVCHESRVEVFKHGHYMDITNPREPQRQQTLNKGEQRSVIWCQPQLDIFSLNSTFVANFLTKEDFSGCGFCIPSSLFFPSRHTPDAMCNMLHDSVYFQGPNGLPRHEAILGLQGRPAYDVVIGTINIHGPQWAAQSSGLFGLFGDTPVELIDPSNITSIRALHGLLASNTVGQSNPYSKTLENIVHEADFRKLSRNMHILRDSFTKVWVWCCWERERLRSTLLDFDQVWARKRQQRSCKLIPSASTASKSLSPPSADWWIRGLRGRSPNPEDPWVAQILAIMPVFRPKMLVRFCQNEHYGADESILRGTY